jgi:hypothetical protein
MDDMTTALSRRPGVEKALAARGVNVVLNEYAVKEARLQIAAGRGRQDVQGRELFDERPAWSRTSRSSAWSAIQPLPLGPHADRPDHVPQGQHRPQLDDRPLQRRSGETSAPALERQWKQITNEVPFNAKFSEDIIAELYKAEDARAKIFAAFALLAVIIGCLGLFGLAAFTAERRTKEIGIRKVLGARTRDIVRLLVWQFSRPVIIANIIAWPVAWWLMRDWLNGFDDQRIALGPTPFLIAGAARAGDRHRDGRRPRLQGRPRQPDPRAQLRRLPDDPLSTRRATATRHLATTGEEKPSSNGALCRGPALERRISRRSSVGLCPSTTRSCARRGAVDRGRADRSTGRFFDIVRFPFAGRPGVRRSPTDSVVLTEQARRSSATESMGQTLTMMSRGIAVDYRVTGESCRICRATATCDDRPRISAWFADARLHHRVGLAVGLGLLHASPGRIRPRSTRAARPGSAQHPDPDDSAAATNPGRRAGLAAGQRPRHPSRPAPRTAR